MCTETGQDVELATAALSSVVGAMSGHPDDLEVTDRVRVRVRQSDVRAPRRPGGASSESHRCHDPIRSPKLVTDPRCQS